MRRPPLDPRAARDRAERALVVDRGAAPDAPEQPRRGGGRASRGARRLRRLRKGGALPRGAAGDRRDAAPSRRRRDAARAERQAGRRLPHASGRTARADRELAARAALGDLGRVPPARSARADDVRPDDRGLAGSTSARRGSCQGTFQTFAAAGEKHYGSADLAGRTILTAGLGGMGGAQPLAATMAGAAILCVEVDPERIERRLQTRYLDEAADSLDDALARVRAAAAEGRALSVGLLGNAAEVVPGARPPRRALRPRHRPDRGARSVDRLHAGRARRARGGGVARVRSGRVPQARPCVDRATRARAARVRRETAAMFSTMATTCEGRPMTAGVDGGVLIPGLRPGLYPAALLPRRRDRSGGRRCRATRPTSRRSTRRCASSSRTTRCCSGGSSWHPSGWRSRGCPRGSAGSASATAPRRGSRSTSSCAAGACRRPS